MSAVRTAVGRYGEDVAVAHLVADGFVVLERNWRARPTRSGARGELDVVALDGDCLVVCEVKTRRSTAFGHPLEAVPRAKAARLRRLAAAWLAEHELRPAQVRVDLLAVLRPPRGPAQVDHVRAVA